jgi:hypothetical protein
VLFFFLDRATEQHRGRRSPAFPSGSKGTNGERNLEQELNGSFVGPESKRENSAASLLAEQGRREPRNVALTPTRADGGQNKPGRGPRNKQHHRTSPRGSSGQMALIDSILALLLSRPKVN